MGNGTWTFLWHDFWNPVGPLLPCYGERIIYDSAIHSNAHVSAVIHNGEWNWHIANSIDLMTIKNSCANYPLDVSKEDSISWSPDPSGAFTVRSTWNHFRHRMPVVNWYHRSGGNILNYTAMNEFHDCLFSLELADVPFSGPLFTWMNCQAGANFIARKLDRCLQNECSLDLFPNAFTEVLPPGLSDHCPLVTSLKVNPDPGPRKLFPFKFFNFWVDHPDFIGLVKEAWSTEVFRTPMFRLTRKLKGVKAILKAFNF